MDKGAVCDPLLIAVSVFAGKTEDVQPLYGVPCRRMLRERSRVRCCMLHVNRPNRYAALLTSVSLRCMCSGTFTVVDQSRTFYTSVKSQSAYAVEYLSADQTRDVLPGVESFVIQSLKTFFTKSMCSLVFIKGFYKVSPVLVLPHRMPELINPPRATQSFRGTIRLRS